MKPELASETNYDAYQAPKRQEMTAKGGSRREVLRKNAGSTLRCRRANATPLGQTKDGRELRMGTKTNRVKKMIAKKRVQNLVQEEDLGSSALDALDRMLQSEKRPTNENKRMAPKTLRNRQILTIQDIDQPNGEKPKLLSPGPLANQKVAKRKTPKTLKRKAE